MITRMKSEPLRLRHRTFVCGCAWMALLLAVHVRAEDAPRVPDFSISTPCDWYKETRQTNQWFERDQQPRQQLMAIYSRAQESGIAADPAQVKEAMALIDEADGALRKALEDLVTRCGWPSRTAFGQAAVQSAYMVVQHAPLDYQLKYLPVITAATAQGEFEKRHLALLTDRILVRQQKPQRYGTQTRVIDALGNAEMFPIEDEEAVDRLRADAGIVPVSICAYASMMNARLKRCEGP